MNKLFIAMVAHENNRAYCLSVGDTSIPPWADASEDQRTRVIAGVEHHLKNTDATPEEGHLAWLAHMTEKGWTFGPVKDDEKKEHPAMVPYAELSQLQRTKDYLFKGIVHVLSTLPQEQIHAAPSGASTTLTARARNALDLNPAPSQLPAGFTGMVAIRYIGKRDTYKENLYGTGLVFTQGEVKLVPGAKAGQLLRHRDVYELVEIPTTPVAVTGQSAEEAAAAEKKEANAIAEEQENERMDTQCALSTMNRKSLAQYAKVNFGQELDPAMEPGDMRSKIHTLIDQLGLPGSAA